MSRFVTPLITAQVSLDRWRLEAQLVYESDLLKKHVAVPAGFVTDFASVEALRDATIDAFGGRSRTSESAVGVVTRPRSRPWSTRRSAESTSR